MNILILNWRDIKNSKSGGAEILTHEIAKRWVKWGNKVTIFSSRFGNLPKEEVLDGVKILRAGHPDARFLFSSVHFQAFLAYKKKFEGKVDVVVDETHGLPFFTPWYVKEKKVALICEVARELWIELFGLFFGSIGRMIEKFYLSFVYRNTPILTISKSTEEDLIEEGVNRNHVTILPMGLNFPSKIKIHKKEETPTMIFIGRLSKSKGIEDAILALSKVLEVFPDAKLWIVGRGEDSYINELKKLSRELKIDDRIYWEGYISETRKFELLSKAHVLLAPSIKEGWGLTVPEAAFAGTPSIVYNSPGLRDVLKGTPFKFITKSNNPDSLAKETIKILKDKNFYIKLARQRLNKNDFKWDKTAQVALEILK